MPVPFCPNCGREVPATAKFCEDCGTALRGATRAAALAGAPVPATPMTAADLQADPLLRAYPPLAPTPDLPFGLQQGELILRAFRPQPRVIVRFAFGAIIASLFLFFFFLLPFTLVFSAGATAPPGEFPAVDVVAGIILVIIVLILGLSLVGGYLAYKKFRYRITNHRTVGRRGMIGFSLDSMPLENIADVIINRSILDRILGLSSVYIQPIGGSFIIPVRGAGLNGLMGSNMFVGLTPNEGPEIQQLIFHLRDLRKRETGRIL